MPTEKFVLLARPHPFIVADMKPMLEQSGFTATALQKMADLSALARKSSGAVISLALTSPISETPESVFAKLRRSAPEIPVLFAGLPPLAKVSSKLAHLAKEAGIDAAILEIAAEHENSAQLGAPRTFLYVSAEDFSSGERKSLAARIIARHFGN
ncbi:MAG: hypothetical protein L0Z07_07550 [Planctomycetes bacterium]|nr:hypothetical protein [Planctomycetota bacterium]